MRLASIKIRPSDGPMAVASRPDGGWVGLGALLGRPVGRLEDELGWVIENASRLPDLLSRFGGPVVREGDFAFVAPVARPSTFRDFYAFEAHVRTARAKRGLDMVRAWYDIPAFYFSNPNSLLGHDAPVFAPAGAGELDYELELGVIVGIGGRNIAPERAWSHVAGLTIVNDWSARDLQRQEMQVGLGPAKGKDFATSVGPCLVTLDEFADRMEGERLSLEMTARVNGRELSRGNTSSLYHTIPRLIAQASRDAELLPGDLIGTGTVGTGCILELGPENAGGWLKAGDVVELEIERIGVLRSQVVSRPA
jgi:2-keto-4-pentenoate hydratase/2-oxohepta-3-ene-1,7-dioic acid hydratase in catechol pathway